MSCKHENVMRSETGVDVCNDCHAWRRNDMESWTPAIEVRCKHTDTFFNHATETGHCNECGFTLNKNSNQWQPPQFKCSDCNKEFPYTGRWPVADFYQARCTPCCKIRSDGIAESVFKKKPLITRGVIYRCDTCGGSHYPLEGPTTTPCLCNKCLIAWVIKVQGEEKSKWDKMAFRVCDAVKEDSKDQSTQLGSVILGPGNEIRSTGYNSFPRGINDGHAYRQERPIKYHYMAHAEENAIANAARMGTPLKGCTLYCQWPPCSTCARLIIGSGIAEVHCREYDVPTRRTEEVIAACEMLVESSVNFVHGGLILLALYERTLKDGKSKTDTEG